MREIQASTITDVVEKLCIEANYHLPEDVKCAITGCRACEDGEIAKGVLDKIVENYEIADAQNVPICQDTGMACVFLEIGQDVHIAGGDLAEAVNEGVRRGYDKGYLRKSVVKDPVRRGNTGDNTPAMLYTEIVPGEQIKVTVGPKGFGSENMSMIRMFKPSAGLQGIKDFILEVVETAGPNPCPPMVVGVGIGGTFDKCALLAKKALMRPIDSENPDPSTQIWKKKCWRKSTNSASDRRALAEKPQPSASISRQCRLILRECRVQSTSTAMLPVIKRR